MAIKYFCITHIGGRPNQEDSVLLYEKVIQSDDFKESGEIESQKAVFAVCDGMGGHYKGEYASRYIAESLKGLYDLEDLSEHTLMEFFKMLQERTTEDKDFPENSGTTVCGVLFEGNRAWIFNFGDSRTYLLNGDTIKQITEDHSLVRFLINIKAIDEETAKTHPMRNAIFLGLGSSFKDAWIEERLKYVKFYTLTLEKNEHLLICSDGLSDFLPEEKIFEILKEDPFEKADKLLEEVLKIKDKRLDNVTYILLRVF